MHLDGLSDFSGNPIDSNGQCRCGSVARVRPGLCIRCLLNYGLEDDGINEKEFQALLSDVQIPDRDWRLGNYQILEEIGRGGMGVIYRARHRPSRRIVALKRVLSYHCDSIETLGRFQREAEAAASLDHPNILPVYDVGLTDDGLPYFSMKFSAGGSLLTARAELRKTPRNSANLIAKVARAIDYAHSRGLLHRDLKPGNILLDGQAEPMVSDFGLAKWLDRSSDLTRTLTIFGTPGYIAPEQAQARTVPLTAAADIYSLGAILFELLAGRPPFLGEHAISVIQQAAERPAPRLRLISPRLDRDLETICAKCLEQAPEARYRSAGDLAADIERWLQNRPIIARQVSPPMRIWRWSTRNRLLTATIVGSVLLGFGAAIWQIDNSRLSRILRREAIGNHSLAILPFLDLESAKPDSNLAHAVATAVTDGMASYGPNKVTTVTIPNEKWTGTGNLAEITSAAEQTNSRAVLTGMFRKVGATTRLSLRVVRENGVDILQHWIFEIPNVDLTRQVVTEKNLGAAIYELLDRPAKNTNRQTDPAIADRRAHDYINAGVALLERRTVPDMDRAISCFKSALELAPRSALARSYLALAYMGRNFVEADRVYTDRAYQVANEALSISPNDSTAHHALCALDISTGHFSTAIEHGLAALEAGDPSERALGQIAFAWMELGRPDKAIDWFNKAKVSEMQPADYDAPLGDAWALLGRDDEATKAYELSTRLRPDLPDGWLGLCHLSLLRGNFQECRLLFEKHAKEYEPFHTTKPFRAELEFFARDFHTAARLYTELKQSDPNGVGSEQYGAISSGSALARIKGVGRDLKSGNQFVTECITRDQSELDRSPNNPEVLYRLAADESIRGNTASALTYLKASIAAGWIDYRSARLDPRFDAIAGTHEFRDIISELAAHVATLGRRPPAEPAAVQ